MADYWTAPKTNWITSDGIGYADLNRIEADVSALRDGTYRKLQGFGYSIDNDVVGEDGVITINPGSGYSSDGFPIKLAANFVKNLDTWAEGNGSGYGGMASAVTPAAHTWYYVFIIMDPTDGSTDIMIDDNPSGTNVSDGTYTKKRFINSFKTAAAGGDSSFDLVEMYSTGDDTVINPNSMYATRVINYPNEPGTDGDYAEFTFTLGAEGFALPAIAVKAQITMYVSAVNVGILSEGFTIPATLLVGGVNQAEVFWDRTNTTYGNMDFSIMTNSSRKVAIAIGNGAGSGYIDLTVRGFRDDRLQ